MALEIDATAFAAESKRLRRVSKTLHTQMQQEIQDAAQPVIDDIRAAVMGVRSSASRVSRSARRTPTSSLTSRVLKLPSGSRGLRAAVAATVNLVATDTTVVIKSDSSSMPAGQASLPVAMDRGRWRHPVMGTTVWVTQTVSPRGWFTHTAARHRNDFTDAVEKALRDAVNQI